MHRSGSEAHRLGLKLLPETSKNIGTHPLHAQQEPFRKCIPPLVPDFDAVVTVFVSEPSEVPSSALSKTSHALSLHSPELSTLVIPANSRFLRFYSAFESTSGEREREKRIQKFGGARGWRDFLFVPLLACLGHLKLSSKRRQVLDTQRKQQWAFQKIWTLLWKESVCMKSVPTTTSNGVFTQA